MCNAFGGIVLIAILVALFVQDTDEDAKPSPTERKVAAELAAKARELSHLEEEIEAISQRIDGKQDLLQKIRERNSLRDTIEALQGTDDLTIAQLNSMLGAALAEKADVESRVKASQAGLMILGSQIDILSVKIEKAEQDISDFVTSRMTESRPPVLRDSSGMQVNFILKYGKVYPLLFPNAGPDGSILSFEERRDILEWDGGAALPVDDSGFDLIGNSGDIRELLELIRKSNQINADLPSKRYYIISFVYADSFGIVDQFRKMIEDTGEIRDGWEPVSMDQILYFSADGEKAKTE